MNDNFRILIATFFVTLGIIAMIAIVVSMCKSDWGAGICWFAIYIIASREGSPFIDKIKED